MFIKKFTTGNPALKKAIDDVLKEMDGVYSGSDEYNSLLKNLERLYALREKDSKSTVSPEILVNIAGNLAGILLILNYERAHVVTSKALSFVMKLR